MAGSPYCEFESLAPPPYLRSCVLRGGSFAVEPNSRSNFKFGPWNSRLAEPSHYSPKGPFLSGPPDSTQSVRLSKVDRFELLGNLSRKWFGRSSRIDELGSVPSKKAIHPSVGLTTSERELRRASRPGGPSGSGSDRHIGAAMTGMQQRRLAPAGLAAKAFDCGGDRGVIGFLRSPFRPKITRCTVWGNFRSIKFDAGG